MRDPLRVPSVLTQPGCLILSGREGGIGEEMGGFQHQRSLLSPLGTWISCIDHLHETCMLQVLILGRWEMGGDERFPEREADWKLPGGSHWGDRRWKRPSYLKYTSVCYEGRVTRQKM